MFEFLGFGKKDELNLSQRDRQMMNIEGPNKPSDTNQNEKESSIEKPLVIHNAVLRFNQETPEHKDYEAVTLDANGHETVYPIRTFVLRFDGRSTAKEDAAEITRVERDYILTEGVKVTLELVKGNLKADDPIRYYARVVPELEQTAIN